MEDKKEEDGKDDGKIKVPMLDKTNYEEWEKGMTMHCMNMKWTSYFIAGIPCNFGMPTLHEPRPTDPVALAAWVPNTVRPEYVGEEGLKDYQIERETAVKARIEYNTSGKSRAWVMIASRISLEVMNEITLDAEYKVRHDDRDYVWLFSKAKLVATGEGAHSACLEFIRLLDTKMSADQWRDYFKKFTVAAAKIKARLRTMTAEQLIDIVFNSIFIVGVINNGGTLLKTEIGEVLRAANWPHYSHLISIWTASLNASEHIRAVNGGGDGSEVKAHVATQGYIDVYAAKQGGAANAGGRPGPSIKCLNCGVPGHRFRACTMTRATCGKCGGPHCDAMHDIAAKLALKRRPVKDSPDAFFNQQKYQGRKAYSADIQSSEDEEDAYADQYEDMQVMQAYMANTRSTTAARWQDRDEDNEDDVHGYMMRMTIDGETDGEDEPEDDEIVAKADIFAHKAEATGGGEDEGVFDTGATGHILKTTKNCKRVTPCMGRYLRGATGDSVPITHTATHVVLGHVNIAPRCADNLISVKRLMMRGFKVVGEGTLFEVFDKAGNVRMRAPLRYDGLFAVDLNKVEIPCYTTRDADTEVMAPVALNVRADEVPTVHGELIEGGPIIHTDQLPRMDYARPLNASDMSRAREAKETHEKAGHPGDESLTHALNNAVWLKPNTSLTGRDVRNMRQVYGPCPACTEGKMTQGPNPTTEDVPAHKVGELLVYDLSELPKRSIGGNTQMLFGRDVHSSFVFVGGLTSKHAPKIVEAVNGHIAYLLAFGHIVKGIMFDSEPTFRAIENSFPGVKVYYSTPGLHNKRAERLKRELNEKFRTTRAACVLELPPSLDLEIYYAAASTINSLPNDQTGPTTTPYQIVTDKRPALREYETGSIAIAYTKTNNTGLPRGEYCIVLDIVQGTSNSYRVYVPQRETISIRRDLSPQRGYPRDWNLPRRRITIAPARQEAVPDPITATTQLNVIEQP